MKPPTVFQGRTLSNRGVHLGPSGQWGMFMADKKKWVDLLHYAGIDVVVALTDSTSIIDQGALDVLMQEGFYPLIRLNGSNLPRPFTQQETVRKLVAIYEHYGVPCATQYLNEPGNDREWGKGIVPPDWWEIWTSRWREGARQIIELGGVALLPDGPSYGRSPFPDCSKGIEHYFAKDLVWYAGHYYTLGRDLWYPYDAAQRLGKQMTMEEYQAGLDDFAHDLTWHSPPLAELNAARLEKANPDLKAWRDERFPNEGDNQGDDVCWRGWEQVQYWMDRDLGRRIPHCMTEGGTTPRARAGSRPEDIDKRYLLPTPKAVAKATVEMHTTESPLFAICSWLWASVWLDGSQGWEDDAWNGGSWMQYGFTKPVVEAMHKLSQGSIDPLGALLSGSRQDIAQAKTDIANADAALARIEQGQ